MFGNSKVLRAGAGLCLTGLILAPRVDAQTALVEEIVVTARKTAETLQSAPITVTAFTSEQITKTNAANLYDLNALSPGLNYSLGPNRGASQKLQMRGLSSGTSGTSKASVFLDGVYISGDISDISFENLERIEVVPGPQSALYGRSTFAGAINYITRNPKSDKWTGHITGSAATLGDQEANAWVGGPVVGEKLLGAINAYYQNFDGPNYWTGANGGRIGWTNTKAGGGKFIFQPSDAVKLTTRATYTQDRDGLGLAAFVGPGQRNGVFVKPNGVVTNYPVGEVPSLKGGPPDGMANDGIFTTPGRKNQNWRTSAQLDWDVAGHTLTALGAWDVERTTLQSDGDFTSFNSAVTLTKNRFRDKSLEIRLASPQDQKIRYTIGGFLFSLRQDGVGQFLTNFSCLTVCTINNPGSFVRLGLVTPTNSTTMTDDHSGFVGVYLDVTDRIILNLEGRYQSERVRLINRITGFNGDTTFNAFLPRVNPQFKINDDIQVYGVFSIGNNPGTFNTSALIGTPGSNTTAADIAVKEEKLYNYEAGVKARWMQGRLTTNLAVFHENWKNQQVPFTLQAASGTLFALVANKGSSRINGFQFESNLAPAQGWDVRGTVSYTYGKYLSFCSTNYAAILGTVTPGRLNCIVVDGNQLDGVPDWTASLSVGYTAALVGDWNWFGRVEYQYVGSQWDSEFHLAYNAPANVFGLHLGADNGRMRIEAFCRNCGNELSPYRIARTGDVRQGPSNQVNQSVAESPRRPRQIGVKAVLDF